MHLNLHDMKPELLSKLSGTAVTGRLAHFLIIMLIMIDE